MNPMRATFAFSICSIAVLGLLALAPAPAAAAAITYDFTGTFDHGPTSDPTNNTISGQFTIDFTSQTITAFDFHTPSGDVTPTNWVSQIFQFTPAVNPADNFVLLSFFNGDGTLALVFRTTLGAFDGSTFYTGLVDIDGGGTGSGFECRYEGPICTPYFGSFFVSGAAGPHTDPPPPTVPEPTTMTLVATGLVAGGALRRRTSRRRD
jgi:hypothetical protein